MTEPTDYYAQALAEAGARHLAPTRAAQLEALIVALLERGLEPDDPRVPLYLAPLLGDPATRVSTDKCGTERDSPGNGEFEKTKNNSHILAPVKPTWKLLIPALLVIAIGFSVFAILFYPHVSLETITSAVESIIKFGERELAQEFVQLPLYLFNTPVLTGFVLLAALAVVRPFLWRWWKRRQKQRLRRGPLPDRSSVITVATKSARTKLFDDPVLANTLRKLRRHRAVPSQRFDVHASIRATIANGAQPVMRFARRRLSPDYVLMSERERPHDHLAELAIAWNGKLCEAGISCEHYEFFGDPNTLRQVAENTGRPLRGCSREGIDVVLSRHEGAQIVVMLESFDALIVPQSSPQWLAIARQTATVHHMNPRDPAYWNTLEARLETLGMAGFPASADGSAQFAERVDRLIDDADSAEKPLLTPGQADLAAFLKAHRSLLLSPDKPEDSQIATIIDTIERWLDRDTYDWLRALALFPLINNSFTFFAGCVLKDETIITHDRYRAIARLPWFRAAYMPDWLRQALVETLSPKGLERVAAVSAAFLTPPKGVIDREEQLLELRIVAQNAADRKKLAENLESGKHPGYNDRLLIEALKGQPPDMLGVILASDFLPPPKPWWRKAEMLSGLAAVMGAGLLLLQQPQSWMKDSGFLESGTYDGEPLGNDIGNPKGDADPPVPLLKPSVSPPPLVDSSSSAPGIRTSGQTPAQTPTQGANANNAAGNTPDPKPSAESRGQWFLAISNGDLAKINAMVNQNLVSWMTLVDDENNSPLHLATERCNLGTMKLFLQNGGNPDLLNIWKDTPKVIARVRCEGGEESPQYKLLNSWRPGPFILFFDYDKSDISAEATYIIDLAVAAYSKGGPWKILLKGYTDGSATRDVSLAIGERYSNSVKNYLVSRGIPSARIDTISFGKTKLSETARVGAPENRKVEIIFELNDNSPFTIN